MQSLINVQPGFVQYSVLKVKGSLSLQYHTVFIEHGTVAILSTSIVDMLLHSLYKRLCYAMYGCENLTGVT